MARHLLSIPVVALAVSACSAMPFLQSQLPTPKLFDRGGVLTPLSTKLADARAHEAWLEIIDPKRRIAPQELLGAIPEHVGPGYFHIKLKSFCLHAGAPAQSEGEGYALAPYKGVRADVLRHVVERSARHPEIAQSDVQVLLWSIEYGNKFDQLPQDKSAVYRALLDATDIATLSFDTEGLKSFAQVSFGANFNVFGTDLADPNVPFVDLERIAVPLAAPPANLGPSHWTFVGNSLYVRATAQSYRETEVELYRPQPFQVERDHANRIVSITSGQTRATIRTDQRLGHGVEFRDLATGESIFIPDSALTRVQRTAQRSSHQTLFGFPEETDIDKLREARQKAAALKEAQENWEAIKRAFEYAQQPNDPASLDKRGKQALETMGTDKYMRDLLVAGESPNLVAKGRMFQRFMYDITDVWMYVLCQMRGQCTGDGGNDGAAATGLVAVPHDTGRQRLGLSNASF